MEWNQAKEYLKKHGCMNLHSLNADFQLIDIGPASQCSAALLNSLDPESGCILLQQVAQLEQFCQDLNPLAYDLIELSERPILLQLKTTHKIHPALLQQHSNWLFHLLAPSPLLSLLQGLRGSYFLQFEGASFSDCASFEFPDELLADFGIIKLESNGLVQVMKP